ncbi:MAG: AAA family ATPase [Candidatus Aminicenantes bacterium]|nr:AAA family ATPase [Candidatus Aminicenantes bacterium]
MVLILDEFDKLLENIDLMFISDYIRLSRYIEKDWDSYGLILAGDQRLVNLTNNETINQFLNMAYPVNIEEKLDEKAIERLIKEPAKHRLTYDEQAIKKIIWYSGKNLYFQQLLCYHIFEFLNKEKKNLCRVEDVEQAVQKVLKKDPKEFDHAWGKKLSAEERVIASALADESITEKKESGYLIKENNLLDNIFGDKLDEEIKKLQDFGYLNEMQRCHFSQYPFKIPLYGKWIQKKHPFIKSVIEDIDTLAEKTDLSTLLKAIEETPKRQLGPYDKSKILDIGRQWCELAAAVKKEKKGADTLQIKSFLVSLSSILGLVVFEKSRENPNCFFIDIKNLDIGSLEEAVCFIQDRPELNKNDMLNIENRAASFAQEDQKQLTLFFHFQESPMVKELVKKTYLSLIPIDENDLKRTILANTPGDTFKNIIISRLSLSKVSPYTTEGPTKAIFYGRSDIINRIYSSSNKSYAIVGARRIGKTSLLYKIKDNPPPNTVYVFISLEVEFLDKKVKNYNAFLKSLEMELERIFNEKIELGRFPFGKSPGKLPGIIRQLPLKGKKLVFLFDEIDGLIEFDRKNNYRLLHIFRTLSQENYCQFVFTGFKELYHRKRDIENPLYNFCDEIRLAPLDKEASMELITTPMQSIGVHYWNLLDRDLILEYTGCHPNLMQFYCQQLIEKIECHKNVEERRTIFFEDIVEIFDSTYEEYIMDDIYMFNSDLTDINRLILVLLAEEHTSEKDNVFSIDQIRDMLNSQHTPISIDDLHRNLKNLVMRFIFVDKGRDRYGFALPIFPEILKKRVDEHYKYKLIKEIK